MTSPCGRPAQIICETRGSLLPDPAHDRVVAVCYAVHDDMHYYASDKAGVEGESIVAERGVITLANRRGAWLGPVAPEAASAVTASGSGPIVNGRAGPGPAPYVSEFSKAFAGAGQGAARRSNATAGATAATGRTGTSGSVAGSGSGGGSGSGSGSGTSAPGRAVDQQRVEVGQRTARQTLFGPRQENFIGLGRGVRVERAVTEAGLFQLVAQVVRRLDPDVIVGYEVQNSSLGYLLARGHVLGVRNPN